MRRPLRWVAVVMAVGIALLGAHASPVCACSCVAATEAEYVQRADVAFEGVVVDVDEPFLPTSSSTPVTVRFKVESVVKGQAGERLSLRTARDEASCGFTFVPGHRYRVFGVGGLTSACAGNKDLGAAPDVPLEEGWRWGVIGAAAAVGALLLGALLLRRGRGTHRF